MVRFFYQFRLRNEHKNMIIINARPSTWQKKRRAADFNCRSVILMSYNAWYTFDENQAAGLWTLVWRVETGCRQSDIRRVSRLISLLSWMTSVKKIHALGQEYVPLKRYTFPRTLEKI